ncbi:MAG: terminase small subunit [Pseudomonadota bacterium]
MSRKLTAKQEIFARKYVECGIASKAYRHAYNAKNMKPETVWKRACELLAGREVLGRVEELQARAAERTELSVSHFAERLEKLACAAMRKAVQEVEDADGNRYLVLSSKEASEVARACSMDAAKLLGLVVNKTEVTRKRSLEDLDDSEIDALIASAEGREGEAPASAPEPSSLH